MNTKEVAGAHQLVLLIEDLEEVKGCFRIELSVDIEERQLGYKYNLSAVKEQLRAIVVEDIDRCIAVAREKLEALGVEL